MKKLPLIAAAALGGAALWSAGWFVGKTVFVEPEADRAVEDIRSGRLFFSYGERTIGGFPFRYDVAYHDVSLSDITTTWRWQVPVVNVTSGVTNVGSLTLTTSPRSVLEVTSGARAGEPPMVFELETDQLSIALSEGAEGTPEIRTTAAGVSAVQKGAGGVVSGGRVALSDLSYVQVPETRTTGKIDLTARAADVAYRVSLDGVTENWTDSASESVEISGTYDLTGFDPAAPTMFVTEGGAVSIEMNIGASNVRSGSSGGPSSPPFTADMSTSGSRLSASVGDGRLSYGGSVSDAQLNLDYEEGIAIPDLSISMNGMEVDFSMPTGPSPDAQAYSLLLGARALQAADDLWQRFDAGGVLPRDPISFRFEVGGNARVFRDLMSLQAAARGGPPIELETLELRDVSLSGLGAAVAAQGLLDVRGMAARPDGTVMVTIDGALALIDSLTAAQLLPADAGNLYKAMGQQILRPGEGDDQFIAEIVSRNGQVEVNGLPMGQ